MKSSSEFKEKLEKIIDNLSSWNVELQREISDNISNNNLIPLIIKDNFRIYKLIKRLYHFGYLQTGDKKRILEKLSNLHNILSTNDLNLENIQFFLLQLKEFLEHEKNYLDYVPGVEKREYIRIIDLFKSKEKKLIRDKSTLEIRGEDIFYDNKIIQGIKIMEIKGDLFLEIKAEHYSNKEGIEEIYTNRMLRPVGSNFRSLEKYCYILEPGSIRDKTGKEIRKLSGAGYANCYIYIKVLVPMTLVWIRVKRNCPAKYAIESSNLKISAVKPQKGFNVKINDKLYAWAA